MVATLTVGSLIDTAEQAAVRQYRVCGKRLVTAVAVVKQNHDMKFISAANGLVLTTSDYLYDTAGGIDSYGCCPLSKHPERTCMAVHAEQLVAQKLMDRDQYKPQFVITTGCPCQTCLKWLLLAGVPTVMYLSDPIADSIQFAKYLEMNLQQTSRDTVILGEGTHLTAQHNLQRRYI